MELERGQIVRSLAGHDKGNLYCVMETNEAFLLLSDGDTKKVNCPKRKRRKHVCYVGQSKHPAIEEFRSGQPLADRELRRALAILRDEFNSQGGNILGKDRYD